MNIGLLHNILGTIQAIVALIGVFTIVVGVFFALFRYLYFLFKNELIGQVQHINDIRLTLGRILILGLEFIIASDLIGTTRAPDYYSLGLLALIVAIRTVLNFSLNRELVSLKAEEATNP